MPISFPASASIAATPATRRAPSSNPHPLAVAGLQEAATVPLRPGSSSLVPPTASAYGSTSAPAVLGRPPAPPTAGTRVVGAAYRREEDLRLGPFPSSSTFPISEPARRANSGGSRPPRPSVDPPSKKKKRAVFVAPHPQSRAPPPGCEVPRRREVPFPGGGLPRQLPNIDIASAATWDARCTASASSGSYVDGDFSPNRSALFDWTRDNAAEDPRTSSSQPFMNLLTQDKDADLQLLMQEDVTPSKRQPKRGSNYSLEEDIQLCKSWINISNDPIIGTDHLIKTYWERIAQDFHRNKDFESDRSANSIEHRCQSILKECMKVPWIL